MFTQQTNVSALTPNFSQHWDKRGVSQYTGKQSNWHFLLEKVTQICCCKFKSNVLYTFQIFFAISI